MQKNGERCSGNTGWKSCVFDYLSRLNDSIGRLISLPVFLTMGYHGTTGLDIFREVNFQFLHTKGKGPFLRKLAQNIQFFQEGVSSGSWQSHGLQHARLPCPSLSPTVCSNSCPLSRWCHSVISKTKSKFKQFFNSSSKWVVKQWRQLATSTTWPMNC